MSVQLFMRFIMASILMMSVVVKFAYSEHKIVPKSEITRTYLGDSTKVEYKDSARYLDNLVFRQFITMNISGSSQYTEKQFSYILENIVENNNLQDDVVLVVDLRGEAHLFVQNQLKDAKGNKMAISSEPLIISDKAGREIESIEEPLLIKEMQGLTINVLPHRFAADHAPILSGEVEAHEPFTITICKEGIGNLETEEQMIRRVAQNIQIASKTDLYKTKVGATNVEYARIPVPDLSVPTMKHVDDFIAAIKRVEAANPGKKVWVHIHCHGGLGRSAFFLYVASMMRSNKSLQEIANEHTKTGARDLLNVEVPEIGQSLKTAQEIKKMIEMVYGRFQSERALEIDKTATSSAEKNKELKDALKTKKNELYNAI